MRKQTASSNDHTRIGTARRQVDRADPSSLSRRRANERAARAATRAVWGVVSCSRPAARCRAVPRAPFACRLSRGEPRESWALGHAMPPRKSPAQVPGHTALRAPLCYSNPSHGSNHPPPRTYRARRPLGPLPQPMGHPSKAVRVRSISTTRAMNPALSSGRLPNPI